MWIALVMAANAGFMFSFTLHLQAGLDYSALRAGLAFLPTSVAFAVVGSGRRLSQRKAWRLPVWVTSPALGGTALAGMFAGWRRAGAQQSAGA